MIQKYILICLFLVANFANAQTADSKNYSKIKFVYDKQSNYYINDEGVFADTLLFKLDFPNLKYAVKTNPANKERTSGFVAFEDFSKENIEKLVSILYHVNESIVGEYDLKKNVTKFQIVRDDVRTKEILSKYFNKKYSKFSYKVNIDYNRKTIFVKFPAQSYSKTFAEQSKSINFVTDISGNFEQINKNYSLTNLILLDKEYESKIVPAEYFTNNQFGVKTIVSITETVNLKTVLYQ